MNLWTKSVILPQCDTQCPKWPNFNIKNSLQLKVFESQTNFQHFLTFQNAAVCIGLSVYSVLVISSKLKDLLDQPDQFADFTSLADLTKQNNNAIAVCVFFSWIKLFKYISFNKTMTQLSSTLSRVSGKQHFSYF